MGFDPFSPVAAAKVNVICVPAGPVTPQRFQEFVRRLQDAAIVKLRDVQGLQSSESFSSSRSENGSVLYNISATEGLPRPNASPFELNGHCQVLLGLVDGTRLMSAPPESEVAERGEPSNLGPIERQFHARFADSPGLVVRKIVILDASLDPPADGTLFVSDVRDADAVRTALIEVSALLLYGLTKLANEWKDRAIATLLSSTSLFGSSPIREGIDDAPHSSLQSSDGATTPASSSSTPAPSSTEPQAQGQVSRGRYQIVLGMLKLQSGMWSDALQCLSDGAAAASSNQDHLWQARSLECLLVTMFLLAWSDLNFSIPDICYRPDSRTTTAQSMRSTPTFNTPRSATPESASKGPNSRQALLQVIPSVIDLILSLYAKLPYMIAGGFLRDVIIESRVRHINLLIAVQQAQGAWDRSILDALVLEGRPKDATVPKPVSRHLSLHRADLANSLFDALGDAQSGSNPAQLTCVMVAIASSLSRLELERKHAFHLRHLLHELAPRLIEARKVGAAEVGVHPAAGPLPLGNSALQRILPDMRSGAGALLALAANAYGACLPPVPHVRDRVDADMDTIVRRLEVWVSDHRTGDVSLKLEMLRICISVCEALPDIPMGLHLTTCLLCTAKRIIAMPNQLSHATPLMSRDEQARLLDNVKKTVAAAARVGMNGLRAEYWDDFLVRDIQLLRPESTTELVAHRPSDLSLAADGPAEATRDPFIYNPFAKANSTGTAPVIVAGEVTVFTVLLQNPLEVEIEIDTIHLIADGCDFEPSHHSATLAPFSLQTFLLSGKAARSGELHILGCRATVRNCYPQDYLTFRIAWQPPLQIKQKGSSRGRGVGRPLHPSEEGPKAHEPTVPEPIANVLKIKVMDPQPRLSIHPKTLTNPSIMLLEGEKKRFELEVQNKSEHVAADLVLLSSEDSVTTRLQDALSNKDLNPAELYEIQYQLATRPSVRVANQGQDRQAETLLPEETATYIVDIFGRAGLTNATIQADYAYLGIPLAEVSEAFYTRHTRFALNVTVNGSVDIPRCNVLPISGDFTWRSLGAETSRHNGDFHEDGAEIIHGDASQASQISHWLAHSADGRDYCMLLLDLRNVWPQPLAMTVQSRMSIDDSASSPGSPWKSAFTVQETLQPGQINRVVLLVPRLFVSEPHAPIPNLDTQKQFVVSASRMSTEAEAASRESFWYREELLKCLRGSWKEEITGRHGEIDLRKGIRLSPRMVDALKLDHVEIQFFLSPFHPPDHVKKQGKVVSQIGRSHFVLHTEEFVTLSVRIHNRTSDRLRPLLRLQPSLRDQPHNIALDLSKRFAWSGVLQRALYPAIEPGASRDAELEIVALAEGHYEINATVEEVKGRQTSSSPTTEDTVAATTARKIWHARSPCLIDAVDVKG